MIVIGLAFILFFIVSYGYAFIAIDDMSSFECEQDCTEITLSEI